MRAPVFAPDGADERPDGARGGVHGRPGRP